MKPYVLAIDQGTTSTKALVLDQQGEIAGISRANHGMEASFPEPGWVEFDPEEIWRSVRAAAGDAVRDAGVRASEIRAIGLSNQGETVVAFDAADGRPLGPALSWQDRRSEGIVGRWMEKGLEPAVRRITGLRLDAYFSAGKMRWILEHLPEARALQEQGRLRMATTDAWLLWRLTGGDRFVTDAATASRTMLFDLERRVWSEELLEAFDLPEQVLPGIVSNAEPIGRTPTSFLGESVLVAGACVDQHAALFGHACFEKGQAKATYGTGCFVLANAGRDPDVRAPGLLTVLGWQVGDEVRYVLEGGVYSAGSTLEWLVKVGLLREPAEADGLAEAVEDAGGVVFVPAFSGLAAPHWLSEARACVAGMHTGTDRRHIVRAALESIAYRVRDIQGAMERAGVDLRRLNVDGGLSNSRFLMQLQADLLGADLHAGKSPEATSRGVGYMAGIGAGLWTGVGDLPVDPAVPRYRHRPEAAAAAEADYGRWRTVCLGSARWTER